jgi:hypothetical protein
MVSMLLFHRLLSMRRVAIQVLLNLMVLPLKRMTKT